MEHKDEKQRAELDEVLAAVSFATTSPESRRDRARRIASLGIGEVRPSHRQ